jgi:hypothetical protein
MRKTVLAQLAKTDPDRAFALHLEQKAVEPDFWSTAPRKFLSSKLGISAEAYIDALKQLPFGDNSTTFPNEKFAEKFGFQTAADGLVKLMSEQNNKRPSSFPANFFSEWSKEDPEGAFAWWAINPSLPIGGLGDILRAMDRLHPDTSSGWLAARLQDSAMPRERIIHTIVNSDVYFANQIHLIAGAMRDDATADAFLTESLAMNSTRRPVEQYANAITALSSPAARLQAFQAMNASHRQLEITQISDAFRGLGHYPATGGTNLWEVVNTASPSKGSAGRARTWVRRITPLAGRVPRFFPPLRRRPGPPRRGRSPFHGC